MSRGGKGEGQLPGAGGGPKPYEEQSFDWTEGRRLLMLRC